MHDDDIVGRIFVKNKEFPSTFYSSPMAVSWKSHEAKEKIKENQHHESKLIFFSSRLRGNA